MNYRTSPTNNVSPPRCQSRTSARRPSFPVMPALEENRPINTPVPSFITLLSSEVTEGSELTHTPAFLICLGTKEDHGHCITSLHQGARLECEDH
jgi:hypothetical protein